MTPQQQTLAVPMPEQEGIETIKDYLIVLLSELWIQREGFSGKRPLGESGWEYDLYVPLARAGLIKVKMSNDRHTFQEPLTPEVKAEADRLIAEAIRAL
jgi:hypothetical protein